MAAGSRRSLGIRYCEQFVGFLGDVVIDYLVTWCPRRTIGTVTVKRTAMVGCPLEDDWISYCDSEKWNMSGFPGTCTRAPLASGNGIYVSRDLGTVMVYAPVVLKTGFDHQVCIDQKSRFCASLASTLVLAEESSVDKFLMLARRRV